jgi:LmbE family N-acetylglucosaminyl deacetylase
LIVTAAPRPEWSDEYLVRQERQIEAAERAYPFASRKWLKCPAARLEGVPLNDLVVEIRRCVEQVRPEVVFVPKRSDAHSDHRVVFSASMAVLKSFHLRSHGVTRVLACEAPSETDAAPALSENAFVPTVFVDVTETFRRKMEIFRCFETEVQPGFGPRSASSVEALARHRGAAVGVEFAEAFMLMSELS